MVVYKITNKVNGKQYIGQTIRNLNTRITEHKSSNSAVGKAIRKYGIDNFLIEVIDEAKNVDHLNELEEKYVTLEFVSSNKTYNSRLGGGNFGKHSDETKLKLSLSKSGEKNPNFGKKGKDHQSFGYKHTEKAKQKMSHKGDKNGMYGRTGDKHPLYGVKREDHSNFMREYYKQNPKITSDETKKKLSDKNLGKRLVGMPNGEKRWFYKDELQILISNDIIYKNGGKLYHRGGDLS